MPLARMWQKCKEQKHKKFSRQWLSFWYHLMTTGWFWTKYSGTCSSLFDHLLIPLSITAFSLSVCHEQFGAGGALLPSLWARLFCAMWFSMNKEQLWFLWVSRSLPGEPTEKPEPFSCVSLRIWKELWPWVIQINGHTTAIFYSCE